MLVFDIQTLVTFEVVRSRYRIKGQSAEPRESSNPTQNRQTCCNHRQCNFFSEEVAPGRLDTLSTGSAKDFAVDRHHWANKKRKAGRQPHGTRASGQNDK